MPRRRDRPLLALFLALLAGCMHERPTPPDPWLLARPSATYRAPTPAEAGSLERAFRGALEGDATGDWREAGYEARMAGDELQAREAAPATRGWGAYAFRPGRRAILVQAPHGESDLHTRVIGYALYRYADARAYATNSAHRRLPGADQAAAPDAAFALLARESALAADMLVVQVHGYGEDTARRHRLDAMALVASDGTREPGAPLRMLAGCLRDAGFDARVFPDEAPYPGGTRNATLPALVAAGRGRFVHLELGHALRELLMRDAARLREIAACL